MLTRITIAIMAVMHTSVNTRILIKTMLATTVVQ